LAATIKRPDKLGQKVAKTDFEQEIAKISEEERLEGQS
jgi:hypothetical protein